MLTTQYALDMAARYDWEVSDPSVQSAARRRLAEESIMPVGEYALLYQCGIANLYRREEKEAHGYVLALLQQGSYRVCEAIAHGLIIAGERVHVYHANIAGDARLQCESWAKGTGGPFDDSQRPPSGTIMPEEGEEGEEDPEGEEGERAQCHHAQCERCGEDLGDYGGGQCDSCIAESDRLIDMQEFLRAQQSLESLALALRTCYQSQIPGHWAR